MSLLSSVVKKTSPSAPKGIIYGPPGIGKSTFGTSAPDVIVIDCENGLGSIECSRSPYLSEWVEIHNWLMSLITEPHEYKTVVIDSIDWLIRRMEEHVSGSSQGKLESTLGRSHGGWGTGKQILRNYIYQNLMPILDRLIENGVAVIMLAHQKQTEVMDAEGMVFKKIAPELPDDVLSSIVEWSDFVLLANKNDKNERYLITSDTTRQLAKNRYNLPPIIEFRWEAFQDAMTKGLSSNFSSKQNESE